VCQFANRKFDNLLWFICKSQIRQFLNCASPLTANLQIFITPVGKEKESQSEDSSVSAFKSEHLQPIFVKGKICICGFAEVVSPSKIGPQNTKRIESANPQLATFVEGPLCI
jgi:hypothetical protein